MEGTLGHWQIVLRLLAAAALGGLIGLERESHGRPAGLRTHTLVALGSCLVMLVSVYGLGGLVKEDEAMAAHDPGRLAAQVVSGIGFLGAGTILRSGPSVKGLTTAASLWVVAGIGLSIGAGYLLAAFLTAGIAVVTLVGLNLVEHRFISRSSGTVTIEVETRPGLIGQIRSGAASEGFAVRSFIVEPMGQSETLLRVSLEANESHGARIDRWLERLSGMKGVRRLRFEKES